MGKKPGRPKGDVAKVPIWCRFDPRTIEGLDKICKSMKPKPSRAQLIDMICEEYVTQWSQKDRR